MQYKPFTRGQTQVLYRHLPHAIFEHDDYGLCKTESVSITDVSINRNALFDALGDALSQWTIPRFADKFPDPRDESRRSRYIVGSPREVRYAPYPLLFSCRRCERVARFSALQKRTTELGKCLCGGALVRMRYVQVHNCGRLEELWLPDRKCSKGHGPEHLALYDPGRVGQARWFCRECGTDIQSLRMTPCKCAYTDYVDSQGAAGAKYEKWLRVLPTSDPSLYIPHTLAFVNFPQETETHLRSASDATGLMLARMWGILSDPVHQVIKQRQQMRSTGDGHDLMAKTIEALRVADPKHALVKQYDEQQARPVGQSALDDVAQLLDHETSSLAGPPRRWLVEHTTLLDKSDLSDAAAVAAMMRNRGDEPGALAMEEAQRNAQGPMGIQAVRVINDFPLALCAFGYTRVSRDPSRAMITPFPADDHGKIPIFGLASETEALWFQLDPLAVSQWLIANRLARGPTPVDTAHAWAWLYRNVPGLRQTSLEPGHSDRSAVAIRTLIHSMSHVFLSRIEWSGFSPSSVGEYLIPGSLSFILYANRYADTKIGGLTTLFEQRLGTWLWDAVQSGRECVYDPICADEGGSCAGCTHREHNCLTFNRELSRATLYGGPTAHRGELGGIRLRQGYWAQAWRTAPEK